MARPERPIPPPDESAHRIIENVISETEQVVRCRCGRSSRFARPPIVTSSKGERYRAKSIEQFMCDGQAVVLRRPRAL